METIRNYLESMFANLPNTPEVLRAKDELLQMMEDKYDELMASGQSENEAVGTVISEFGNLDELADDLGIRGNMPSASAGEEENNGRQVSKEEAVMFIKSSSRLGLLRAAGIALCILSVSWPMLGEGLFGYDGPDTVVSRMFVAGMFVFLAAGVALIIASSMAGARWRYLREEPCFLDYATFNHVQNEKDRSAVSLIAMKVVGIMFCILSLVPSVLMDGDLMGFHGMVMENMGAALLFLLVAIGVFLIVLSGSITGSYNRLLKLNSGNTVKGNYSSKEKNKKYRYENENLDFFMSVYGTTVLCLYLMWSFLTFNWHITWIIWPVAWVIRKVIETNLGKEEGGIS